MNTRQRRVHEMLNRVSAFGSEHEKDFPAGTVGRQTFAIVGGCVRDVARAATEHNSERRRGVVAAKAAARKALWHLLDAIRRTAHAIALDSPRFDRPFRLPRGNGDSRLLAAARAVKTAARKSAAEFIAHGLPPAFLDDLAHRLDAFERAGRESRESRFARRSAREGIEASLVTGFLAVRRLDAVVPNVLGDDLVAMAAWKRARRVARKGRSLRTAA